MKPELYRAINNRDGAAMASIAGGNPEHGRVVNSDAERLVDALFMQLKQIFPAATQTNLRSDADERVAKQQWIAAFSENGIRTRKQLSAGMQKARSSQSPFWPSPGQFISWCREGSGVLGVSVDDIMGEYWRWRKLVFRYPTSEQFPWRDKNPLYYHVCLELRRRGTEGQLSEKELHRAAGDILHEWEKRVLAGKPIPPVRRALAAPSRDRGPTPAEMLMAKYKQRKDAGLI
ncbi:phage replication protein [Salmonella enterica subsp. enterica serovar Typhimurium]|uniref:Phage replication protein n=4 Tax=Salmonella enterica I TaxID=59201 RepID=A0A5T4ISW1_SALTM|nr:MULTISPECIES: replication protein P [Salmonella]EAA2043394.1 phage replication protein [Salmonella enterica subsp. enterica serovar Chester]EBG0104233.1 phage replication protein [Salmonella enterica subsp. enterica serovar Saintpaul]EBR0232955.1 phage replication protein [Salmonella enterica subsp. enterica serovar Corvallis]EBU9535141.1 phage replication protein [Salmonella enterica subsp. enterica serovar Bovismorbificans]ECB7315486.1 phage replication protein [Salmonella enterica subsp.